MPTVLGAGLVLTSSWTGVKWGQFPVSDLFLVGLLLSVVLSALTRSIALPVRTWMLAPAVAGLVCLVSQAWFPPDLLSVDSGADPAASLLRLAAATTVAACGLGWLVVTSGPATGRRLLHVWLVGAAMNACVAVLGGADALGLGAVVSTAVESTRANGLTNHPNSLACAMVVTIPVAFWMLGVATSPSRAAFPLVVLTLTLWALISADSRAGFGAGLLALVVGGLRVIHLTVPAPFRPLCWAVFGALAGGLSLSAVQGSRLDGGGSSADQSDFLRAQYLDAGLELFRKHPLTGVGLDSASGVSVPVALLSSGGIVLLLGYYLFPLGCASTILRRRPSDLVLPAMTCLGAGIVFQIFNNGVTERYLFIVPIIAAFSATQRTGVEDRRSSARSHSRPVTRTGAAVENGALSLSNSGSRHHRTARTERARPIASRSPVSRPGALRLREGGGREFLELQGSARLRKVHTVGDEG